MSRGPQYIELEGLFAPDVLGIFTIVRGFADLRDLAAISVPYQMTENNMHGRVTGHQRQLDEKHTQDIKKYLEQRDNRFIPEIILSVRYETEKIIEDNKTLGVKTDNSGPIIFDRRFSGKNHRIQRLWIKRIQLEPIREQKLIRRIDGNHRLALAAELEEDAAVPKKYLAPFCLILLGPPDNDADDYAESLIFHTINSTALPLESEHSLRLLLGQNPTHEMTPDSEFAYSPELHFTRLLRDRMQGLPRPAQKRFGKRPLTVLSDSAQNLIKMDASITATRDSLTAFSDDFFAALSDILTRLNPRHPSLCQTYSFLELTARVWKEVEGTDHDTKVNATVDFLDRLGKWLGNEGITNLLEPLPPAKQLLEIFKAAQSQVPKRIFLARWYPNRTTHPDAFNKAELRLQQLRQTIENIEREKSIRLKLIDLGTEEGGTYPIHPKMYEAVASSDIIICDLTGLRPNVCIEMGYALKHHEKNRLILLFEPQTDAASVPFDITTFKYEPISQAAEIPDKLKPAILKILRDAGLRIE